MQTQLTCPACNTPFVGEITQVIDVGLQPELKQMLLTGALNVVRCPACGASTRVSTPIIYHDPEHEHFMVHVPMEIGMGHNEQEKVIGQLIQRAMDQLPPEQRRGYMFQPQTILSQQTLIEKVLESEGVTPEMMARQRAQTELLQTLLQADRETVDKLIAERADEFDEQFFAMLSILTESAEESGQEEVLLKLLNLRAKLYRRTEYGRRLETQQKAIHNFNREAKKAGQATPELLLKHVLANRQDPAVIEALIGAATPAFNYEFFLLLTERIEKRQKSGIDAGELIALRERLLKLQQAIDQQSRQIVEQASQTLQSILAAENLRQAVRENLPKIDDSFMYVLSASIGQAEERGDRDQAQVLLAVYEAIREETDAQLPQEIRWLNQIMSIEDEDERRRLLDETPEMATPEFLEVVRAVSEQAADSGRSELSGQLERLEAMIASRITT